MFEKLSGKILLGFSVFYLISIYKNDNIIKETYFVNFFRQFCRDGGNMDISTYLVITQYVLLTAIVFALISALVKRNQKILTPVNILIIGVFIASAFLLYPFCRERFFAEGFTCTLLSIYHSLQLFVVGGSFDEMKEFVLTQDESIRQPYTQMVAAMYVLAPVLTFSFILSLFQNAISYVRYTFRFFKKIHVFSELSEKSLALAESIVHENRWSTVVFADVFERDDEIRYELTERAAKLGAISFKKDILSIRFGIHCFGTPISFFIIGADESENVKQALGLVKRYGKRRNTNLYAFSTHADGEILLANTKCKRMRVRRISDVRSLVYHLLYQHGEKLFEQAILCGDEKKITVVLAGLGAHGTEMLKGLAWFCQMEGYGVTIHAFEKNQDAESVLKAACPELMDRKNYDIQIHAGIDVATEEFIRLVRQLPVTYAFVALGNDSDNIQTALTLRTLFYEQNENLFIQAVVYDSEKVHALEKAANFQGEAYNISFVGDLKTSYSADVILNSKLEAAGLMQHISYLSAQEQNDKEIVDEKTNEFWNYEYYYRSSVARMIHDKMRVFCNISGAEKMVENRTPEEREKLRKIEHSRWKAYMRGEGYIYGETRKDIAKRHHLLVPYETLSDAERRKND